MDSFKEIITGCVKGQRAAQEKLYKKFSGTLFAICLRYSKNRMEAEDILQEVFVKIYTYIHTYHFDGSFEGWLKRIAVNTSITYYRKALKKQLERDIDDGIAQLPDEAFMFSGDYSMEDMLKCIEALPLGYRTVFNMHCIEGYKHKEIAELLKIDINTSKSQLSRAKVHLQNELGKLNDVVIKK
jgi:RNA polymerase sigma-70 factor (ECF subfamily)